MKKSLIAAAVTGAFAVSGAAMAQPTVYGKVNLGMLSQNDDAADSGNGEISLADGASRLGFTGEEDLGNGLTAIYTYELGIDARNMSVADPGRLSFVGLTGDFGEVKAGRMWVGFYNHVGSIADLGDIVAAVPGAGNLGLNPSRVGDTIEYTGGTDAFEFTLGGVFGVDAAGSDGENIDRTSISGVADAGPVSISAGVVSQADTDGSGEEPTTTGFGVTGSAGNLGYGASYITSDPDDGTGEEPSALDAYVSSDFGGGVGGFVGVSQFDADTTSGAGDITSFWGHVDRSLSSRTRLYAEFQSDSIDGGAAADTDPQQIVVGINHDF